MPILPDTDNRSDINLITYCSCARPCVITITFYTWVNILLHMRYTKCYYIEIGRFSLTDSRFSKNKPISWYPISQSQYLSNSILRSCIFSCSFLKKKERKGLGKLLQRTCSNVRNLCISNKGTWQPVRVSLLLTLSLTDNKKVSIMFIRIEGQPLDSH